MATVPIEIVLQDAETPVDPTPESGEETNIVVPNTGTISNDGSSNGGIESSISIILPIVIAVLALSAMVALLIRRQQKRKSNTEAGISKKEKLATAASGTVAILAATVLVGNLVIPTTNAATSVAPGTAELETEDKITIIATREQDSDEVVATVKNISYATANLDFGYKVTASMAEGATTANLYLDGDETSEYYIAPVEDGALANNTWGYALEEPSEDTAYLSIPLEDTPTTIVKGNNEIEGKPVDIYYTIKVDKSLPTGTYTGELEYSIAPAIEYMQDFAKMTEAEKTATLANMPEGQQYILKDIRDKKPYYISKLADGNVWMTQNLDHDIGDIKGGTYTSVDTDIPEDWTPTGDELTSQIGWDGGSTSHVPRSYDPGILYWNGAIVYNEETCTEYGGTWSSNYGGTCYGYDTKVSTGNSHYHLGNYYNWTAAVAMSDSSSYTADNTDVDQSICPAGWMLPKGGATLTGSGSFIYLKDVAILTSGANGNVNTDPNYFVYSGGFQGGELGYIGYSSRYWSSVVQSVYGSYNLNFDADGYFSAKQQYGAERAIGASVRCIAR